MEDVDSDIQRAREAIEQKDFEAARSLCLSALERTGASPEGVRERIDILLTLSDVCKHTDRMQDNIECLGWLVEIARSAGDTATVAKALIRMGFVYNRQGRRDLAMERFDEAEAMAKDLEDRIQYGYALAGKANIFWRRGENRKAIELAKQVLEIGLANKEYTLTAGAANVLSSAFFELAQFKEALRAASLSVGTYRNLDNVSDLARALNNQGEIFKRMGSYNMAIESYEEGISVLDSHTVKRFGYLYTNLAECRTRMGALEDARTALERAGEVLRGSEDNYALACMWYVTGLLKGAMDLPDESREWLERAEAKMEDLGVAYDLGVVRHELVRHHLKAGSEAKAKEMAEKAIYILQKAGAVDLVEETRRLLE
jgi:tetratricopeptide (TPR) repeat protein